jgi:Arc/MetJ-type ribon-helix-helix transcriptional regulator
MLVSGIVLQPETAMITMQLPDDLKHVIDRQVTKGHAASEAEFLAVAIQRYAEALERDEDEIAADADKGIADFESGHFQLIAGPEDMQRLREELGATLYQFMEALGTIER